MHVEPQEIDQLAGTVDFRLIGRLALAQHRGRIEELSVGAGQQFGGPEEHGRPVFEAPVPPIPLSLDRSLYCLAYGFPVRLVHLRQHPLVAMRGNHVMGDATADFTAADDGRYISRAGTYGTERRFERGSFGRSR